MENRANYRPDSASGIVHCAVLELLDLPGMHATLQALVDHCFRALAKKGHLTKTSDVRIVKVLRQMAKDGLLCKKEGGYARR